MKYHFIAIGGTGMGALAGLLRARGEEVRGSDVGVYPPMSDQLAALQIPVMEGYSGDHLAWGPDRVVVGNVCTKDHVEVVAAQQRGLTLTSLPAVLGEVFLADRHSMVVAGTHGKTTTSSLLAHLLIEAGRDPGYFIGGVPHNFGQGWRVGTGNEFVVEGDEYDTAFFDKESKFLHYRPRAAILTSVELDHVDIFSGLEAVREAFRKFVRLIPEDGLLVAAADEPDVMAIARKEARCRIEAYRVEGADEAIMAGGVAAAAAAAAGTARVTQPGQAEWEAKNLEYLPSGRASFELRLRGEFFERFETMLAGDYNIANAVAAIALAHSVGVPAADLRRGLATFAGVRRRQEIRGIAQGVYVIDDYAHHPTSVSRTLTGLRHRFPGRRLVAIYEPRSATSRRNTFQREYADALADADAVVIGKPYDNSRIPKEERFDPEAAAHAVHQAGTRAAALEKVEDIVAYTIDLVRPGDVVVVFSSGSFDGLHDKLLFELGDAVIPARRNDMPEIAALLKQYDLDWQDVQGDDYRKFLCLINESGFVGCVALEVYVEEAVLRSLAVKPEHRGGGYGWMLADSVINMARRRGVKRIYLVTASASDFFAEKHGFRVVNPSTISPAVTQSNTFRRRDGKQVAMRLDL